MNAIILAIAIWAQVGTVQPIASYHHCTLYGGTSNGSGYQSMTELYKCEEGTIELGGKWTMFMEGDWIYSREMGRVKGEPEPAKYWRGMFKWCPVRGAIKPTWELCGLWPEHGQIVNISKWREKCIPGKRGDPFSDDCVCRKDGKSLFCKDRADSAEESKR